MPYRRLVFLLLVLAATAGAQEQAPGPVTPPPEAPAEGLPEGVEPAAAPEAVLSRALLELRKLDELAVRARVTQEAAPAGNGAVAGVQIMIAGGRRLAMGAGDFEGEVEAWRGADDVTVVLSSEALPGFRLFSDGSGPVIKQTTFLDDIPSFDVLEAELIPLLDRRRFLEHVLAADLHASFDPGTETWIFQGAIAREVINPLRGGMAAMGIALRVLRCDLRLVIPADGRIERIELEVVRNDPMREARARGVLRGPGGQPAPEDEQAHEFEGGRTKYSLTVVRDGPSEEARAFRREMLRLRGAEAREDEGR